MLIVYKDNRILGESSVGIATGYGMDRGVGAGVPVGSRIISSPCRPDRGTKRPGREADHSPPN
jgi:hypothetical protein